MASPFPLKFLPLPQNKRFFGRAAELEEISDRLNPSNPILTSRGSRSVLIHGMGGVGKTQLALQYAYTRGDRYDAVFWIRCDTMIALSQSCYEIVQSLGLVETELSTAVVYFTRWLANTSTGIALAFSLCSNMYSSAISPHYGQRRASWHYIIHTANQT